MSKQVEKLEGYDWWLEGQDIESWAYIDNLFTDEEIDTINRFSKKSKAYLGDIGSRDDAHKDLSYRNSTISNIKSTEAENKWLFERVTGAIQHINQKFWKFDLNRIETLQYSEYTVGQFYKAHIDTSYHSFNNAVRKLSFSIQLTDSDDYDGGDLLLITGDKPTPTKRTKGSIIFFPSFALHEVATVTRGTRRTLVGWATGPAFK